MQIEVSLKPLSNHNKTITKQLPCISHNMRTFRASPAHQLTINTDSHWSSDTCGLHCISSWLYWLDPGHWMENIWPQSRIVIFIILLVIFIIVLSIIIRMIYAVLKCCGCCVTKKK